MKGKDIIKQRPTKFVLEYGLNLKEMAALFDVSTTTIWSWLKNSKKREWLLKQVKEIKEGK